ncbi:MAG TPA: ABC transporter ATP-binding protein [Ktedonobacterales bacterium]|nr:ABC transporter ATP-binding protein [Ktedonobacterales bacterium]
MTPQTSSPLSAPAEVTGAAATDQPLVALDHVVKRYGQATVVNDVSLAIRRGEIFGILGPNGAGKTTTLEMIEGVRAPDSGTIRVDGLDTRRQRRAMQQRIGVQLQTTSLFEELTVRETIALFGAFFPRAVPASRLLTEVGLAEQAGAHPQNLSGGQRQRLALALALVNDPLVIFLDEPTSGLDPQSRRMLWETIKGLRARGKTVVLTTHFMDEAQLLCDRLAIMDHGRIIAQDTPAGLIARLGTSATIACALSAEAGATALTVADLGALPGVTTSRQGPDLMTLYTGDTERTLTALLRLAAAHRNRLDHVQLHAPTLEDVFLSLTGRELRG